MWSTIEYMQIVFTCSGAAAQHKYHTILEFCNIACSAFMRYDSSKHFSTWVQLQPIEVHQFSYPSAHGFRYNLLGFINFIAPQLMGSATTY